MNWKIIRAFNIAKRYCLPKYVSVGIRRGLRRGKTVKGLTNVNISTTTLCSADCIFCPPRGDINCSVDFMSTENIEKILKEMRSRDFRRYHNIQVVSVGENGDFFLHKDCLTILAMLRAGLPGAKIQCFTNFRMFTKDKIDAVLKEKLIDYVGCNIDGADAKSYFRVKRGDYAATRENLLYFIKERRRLWRDIPILLSALTFHDYVKGIYFNLKVLPHKVKEVVDIKAIKDDFPEIKDQFKPFLDHPKDKILRSGPIGWAERDYVDASRIKYDEFSCPLLERIEKEAFISPDGNWYACCWDTKNELKLGNVFRRSINEVFFSETRRKLIDALRNKKFKEIGGPCRTVHCCQSLK
ncbi:MAG TPA: radical SAM protein [Patescibacteria group bacterium]|nr:radical SAM protein [Patescibacteria group bacterium]